MLSAFKGYPDSKPEKERTDLPLAVRNPTAILRTGNARTRSGPWQVAEG
ncbi:hypothetical protein SAMN03097708_00952 [Thiohalomonas denitrificans]|uniref:Uncharacterized protein n=1 Tax=Thiohalomonas denitrificans TaxID=415747 RepID=A0A1G5PVF8_9GAMM|nr:hypothetical protein SAMN03097708_00952 [Thiohalomonas denitrificans]